MFDKILKSLKTPDGIIYVCVTFFLIYMVYVFYNLKYGESSSNVEESFNNFENNYTNYENTGKLENVNDIKNLKEDEGVILLMKGNHCGHCKNFYSTWLSLYKHYENHENVKLFNVECDGEKLYQEVVKKILRQNITGVPTLFFIKNDKILEFQGVPNFTDITVSFATFLKVEHFATSKCQHNDEDEDGIYEEDNSDIVEGFKSFSTLSPL